MLHRSRSRDSYGGATGPTNFTKQQMGDYLTDLRSNKPARPNGSRPPPPSSQVSTRRSMRFDEPSLPRSSSSSDSSNGQGHSRASSSIAHQNGRPSLSSGRSSPEKMWLSSIRDRSHHKTEREQSHSVRVAMDNLHFEQGSYFEKPAKVEAQELMRKHQHPHAPYPAPAHTSSRTWVPTDPADIEYDADGTRYRNGVEIRSDEIRAATSRSLHERSPNLPSPAFVCDDPERPIVSFDKDWTPSEEQTKKATDSLPRKDRPLSRPSAALRHQHDLPNKTTSAPVVPTLRDMDEASLAADRQPPSGAAIPYIAISDDLDTPDVLRISIEGVPEIYVDPDPSPAVSTPAIVTPSIHEPSNPRSAAVTPTPRPRPARAGGIGAARPPARHAVTAPSAISPTRRTPHAMRGGSTLCAQCALPIYGRTVTAAGTRFHPECFACFHCGEGLECVQFYPEPGHSREARLERIEARMAGEEINPPVGQRIEDDNDDSLRFYCHLDYHEFFSPRCKNCKTPIEGEMIIALGAQYHPEHFFCANCGDVSRSRRNEPSGIVS